MTPDFLRAILVTRRKWNNATPLILRGNSEVYTQAYGQV